MLLHPTSLPGRFGTGDLGPEADRFLDWAAASGFTLWQVLPLGPTGPGNSPYGCASAFAGNALLVSPEELVLEGLLPAAALQDAPELPGDRIDWERVIAWKEGLLRRSLEHFGVQDGPAQVDDLAAFAAAPEQAAWLADWALFAALRARAGGAPWWSWDEDLAQRRPKALARARRELAAEVDFQV
ncbi:MAG: 4-alpha-glucanotransferase, partial [Thermoanaerobaculia bacterium]